MRWRRGREWVWKFGGRGKGESSSEMERYPRNWEEFADKHLLMPLGESGLTRYQIILDGFIFEPEQQRLYLLEVNGSPSLPANDPVTETCSALAREGPVRPALAPLSAAFPDVEDTGSPQPALVRTSFDHRLF